MLPFEGGKGRESWELAGLLQPQPRHLVKEESDGFALKLYALLLICDMQGTQISASFNHIGIKLHKTTLHSVELR